MDSVPVNPYNFSYLGRSVKYSSTQMGWILGRTVCFGEDDLPNVYALQEKLTFDEAIPGENSSAKF